MGVEMKKMIILAISGFSSGGVTGYLDDRSEEYKRFTVNPKGKVKISATYPKERYGGRLRFAAIMGKWDIDTLFLIEPPEVERLDFKELEGLYPKLYQIKYHGGFTLVEKDADSVGIIWDSSGRREVFTKSEWKDLKLNFKKVSKNHYTTSQLDSNVSS